MAVQLLKKQNPQAHLQVICLHHAAGSAAMYLNWQAYLPDFIELCAIQLPGRAQSFREPLIDDINHAAEEIATLIDREITKPYILFGHSLGALLGFESIRYLDEKNMKIPIHFFASGLGAPHVLSPSSRRDLLSDQEMLQLLASYDEGRIALDKNYYDLLRLILPAAFADFKIHDTYIHKPGNLLPCPITAIAGDHDEIHSEKAIRAWCELTTKECNIKLFSGGHMYFMDHPKEFLSWFSEQLNGYSSL